jgi:hypothetical protein
MSSATHGYNQPFTFGLHHPIYFYETGLQLKLCFTFFIIALRLPLKQLFMQIILSVNFNTSVSCRLSALYKYNTHRTRKQR